MSPKAKEAIKDWTGIVLGCLVIAVGFVFFINPYNIVPGGTYGASIVLHTLFPSIQVGTFGYCFEVPLLILSAVFLGAKLGARTLVASLLTPGLMNGLSWLVYPDAESLRNLDPTLICGGMLNMQNAMFLTTLFGAILVGVGCGIIVRSGATSGGTDIIAMIMQKYLGIRFSRAVLIADGVVVGSALIVFSIYGNESLVLTLYSALAIYVVSQSVARTINGSKDHKIIFVVSSLDLETLHHFILHDLDRTATFIKAAGLYSKKDKEMLFIVVNYKEVQRIKHAIKEVDPSAFVVVSDAYDTFGEGWKTLPSKAELQPE